MKKVYSLLAAALIATSAVFASENLYNPAVASLETYFATGGEWSDDTESTAQIDAEGSIAVSIALPKQAQWQAQVKLSTGLTSLDPAKQYDFSATLLSTVAINGVVAKMFDDAIMFEDSKINLEAAVVNPIGATHLEGKASNGIIVFDFGFAPAGAEILISDIVISESEFATTTCAELASLDKNTEVTMGDFDVVLVQGSNTYIKDATGAALLFASNFGLVAGDHVAAGLKATVDYFNGLVEIKPTSTLEDLVVTAGEAPALPTAAALPGAENVNQVVIYKNVTFAEAVTISKDVRNATGIWNEQELAIYNNFKLDFAFEAGKAYNITAANAVYTKDDKTTWQVYFLAAEEFKGQQDDVDPGLYDASKAQITKTYFATGQGWAADNQSSAELVDGQLYVHLVLSKEGQWQSQIFLYPGFVFEPGKKYSLDFDLETNNQLGGVTVKIGDADEAYFYSYPNDNTFLANTDTHFSSGEFEAKELDEAKRLIIFAFGWLPDGTEVRIHNIQIKGEGAAVDNIAVPVKAQKVIIDGQVYIIRNGVRFNALGAQVQ